MPPRKRQRPEQSLHMAVCDHLRDRGVPGLLYWHTNNNIPAGGNRSAIQGARLKRMGVLAGVSDLLLLHNGRLFALELKAEKGRPTEAQMEFTSRVNSAGGFATIASGIDQALKVLTTWGLIRGRAG